MDPLAGLGREDAGLSLQQRRAAMKVIDAFEGERRRALIRRLREGGEKLHAAETRPEKQETSEFRRQVGSALSTLRRMGTAPRGADLPLWRDSDYYALDYVVWTGGVPPFRGRPVFPPAKQGAEQPGSLSDVLADVKGQAKELGSSSSSGSGTPRQPDDGAADTDAADPAMPPPVPPGGARQKGLKAVLQKMGNPRSSVAGIPLCRRCNGLPFGGAAVDILPDDQRLPTNPPPTARTWGAESPREKPGVDRALSQQPEPTMFTPPTTLPEPAVQKRQELQALKDRRAERLAVLEKLQSRLGDLEERVAVRETDEAAKGADHARWLDVLEENIGRTVQRVLGSLSPEESVIFHEFIDKDTDLTGSLDRAEIHELIRQVDPSAPDDDVDWFVSRCMESIQPKEDLSYPEFYQWWQSWMEETGGADARGSLFQMKMKMRQVSATMRSGLARMRERVHHMRTQVEAGVSLAGIKSGVTGMVAVAGTVAVVVGCLTAKCWRQSHEEVLVAAFRRNQVDVSKVPDVIARFAEIDSPQLRRSRILWAARQDCEELLYDKECVYTEVLLDVLRTRRDADLADRCARDRQRRFDCDDDGPPPEDASKVEVLFSHLSDELDTFGRISRSQLPLFAQLMGYSHNGAGVTFSQMQVTRRNYAELLDLEETQEWWWMLKTGGISRMTKF